MHMYFLWDSLEKTKILLSCYTEKTKKKLYSWKLQVHKINNATSNVISPYSKNKRRFLIRNPKNAFYKKCLYCNLKYYSILSLILWSNSVDL